MQEVISVIVPVYKAELYLRRCLDSILSQTYPYLEIILVDDGSPDNSGVICDEYAAKDDRIKVIHQENLGVSAARNAGINIACGDWIAFVDSDDYIDADMYAYLLQLAKSADADLVQCDAVLEGEKGSWHRCVFITKEDISVNQWKFLASECWGKLYRRSLIGEERFPQGCSLGEDLYFNVHIMVQTQCFVAGHQAKYHYIQTEGSLFRSNTSRERIFLCRNIIDHAIKEFYQYPVVYEYLRLEKLRNTLDVCSRIVLNQIDGVDGTVQEMRKEVRSQIKRILWKEHFVKKEKFKFLLVGYFWPLYCSVLPRWKKRC